MAIQKVTVRGWFAIVMILALVSLSIIFGGEEEDAATKSEDACVALIQLYADIEELKGSHSPHAAIGDAVAWFQTLFDDDSVSAEAAPSPSDRFWVFTPSPQHERYAVIAFKSRDEDPECGGRAFLVKLHQTSSLARGSPSAILALLYQP